MRTLKEIINSCHSEIAATMIDTIGEKVDYNTMCCLFSDMDEIFDDILAEIAEKESDAVE